MSERQVLLKLLNVLLEWKGQDEKGRESGEKQARKGDSASEGKGKEGDGDTTEVSTETSVVKGEKTKNGGVWAAVARRSTGRRATEKREEERAKVEAEVKDRLLHRPTVMVYYGRKALSGVALRELNEGFAKIFRSPLPMNVRLSGSHLLVTFSYKDEAIAAIQSMLRLAIKATRSGGQVKGLPCPDCHEQKERVVRDDVMRELLHMLRAYPDAFRVDMNIKEAFTMVCEHHPGAYSLLAPWLKSFSPDTSAILTPRKLKEWEEVEVDARAAARGVGLTDDDDQGGEFEGEESWTNQEASSPMRELSQALQQEQDAERSRVVVPHTLAQFFHRKGYTPRTAEEQLEALKFRRQQALQQKLKAYGGKAQRRPKIRQREKAKGTERQRTPSPITPVAERHPTLSGGEGRPKIFAKEARDITQKDMLGGGGPISSGWGEGFWAPDHHDSDDPDSYDSLVNRSRDKTSPNLLRTDPNVFEDWILTKPADHTQTIDLDVDMEETHSDTSISQTSTKTMPDLDARPTPPAIARLIQGSGMSPDELERLGKQKRRQYPPRASLLGTTLGNVTPSPAANIQDNPSL